MVNTVSAIEINCDPRSLANGQCTMDVRKPGDEQTLTTIGQDLALSSTYFIGTFVMIALMVSGLMYILAKDDSAASKAKNGIKWSFIGFLLVLSAHMIIRFVQYVAQTGG